MTSTSTNEQLTSSMTSESYGTTEPQPRTAAPSTYTQKLSSSSSASLSSNSSLTSQRSQVLKDLSEYKYGFPMGTFIGIMATMFSFFFAINVIFPFVPFMVHDFFPHANKSDLGYYVGYLDSAFFTGSVIAAILWSRMSDIYGRKPILLIGIGGSLFATVLFGLSLRYEMALITRFIWGALDGNLGVCKTVLGEISSKSNQSRLYTVIGILAGMGRLVGNMIAMLAFIAWLVVYKYLIETLDIKKRRNKSKIIDNTIENDNTKSIHESLIELLENDSFPPIEPETEKEGTTTNGKDDEPKQNGTHDKDVITVEDEHMTAKDKTEEEPEEFDSAFKIWKIRNARTAVFYYAFLCLINTSFQATIPLWLILHRSEHGFNYRAHNIGTIFACIGPIFMMSQILLFHKLVTKFGYIRTGKCCGILNGILSFILPHLAYFNKYSKTYSMLILIVFIGISSSSMVIAFTISMTLVNNSTHPSRRAMANGFGQSVGSIARFLAPIVMCNLFSFTADKHNNFKYPFNYVFVFYLQGIICVGSTVWLIVMLPKDFENVISLKKKNKLDSNNKNYKTLDDTPNKKKSFGRTRKSGEMDASQLTQSFMDFSMG